MADEPELTPETGAETIDAPADGEIIETTPDPIEALAGDMGWVPQDQWQGAPEEWRPATDFIRAGRDINRSLSRELRSVREEVGRMSSVSSQILADKLAEKDAYWKNIHARAVEDGDQGLADRAVDERIKLKAETPQPQNTLPPETADFMERHKNWMGKDPLATMRAEEIANQLAQRGVSIPDQLAQVERAMRKEFPEHFSPPGKQPPGVQTGQARNAGKTGGKKGFADMPPESQAMAKDYLTRHGVPLEKFAESYFENEAGKRRVG